MFSLCLLFSPEVILSSRVMFMLTQLFSQSEPEGCLTSSSPRCLTRISRLRRIAERPFARWSLFLSSREHESFASHLFWSVYIIIVLYFPSFSLALFLWYPFFVSSFFTTTITTTTIIITAATAFVDDSSCNAVLT